tara:strand:- start:499 stop:816 length:318 start_codon:yes stop_codon:yes gene_type:complete
MAKLSKTQVTYNGESFELGSEEARIIYTALKALNDGTAKTDGVGLSNNSWETGSDSTSFLFGGAAAAKEVTFNNATAGQLYLTSSNSVSGSGANAGRDWVVMMKR